MHVPSQITFLTLVCEAQSPSRYTSRRAIPRHAPLDDRDFDDDEDDDDDDDDDEDDDDDDDDDEQ